VTQRRPAGQGVLARQGAPFTGGICSRQPGDLRRRTLLGAALLGGCSLDPDVDHDGADAPRSGALPRLPRTAWVFSSGGPRGFVHVGVLKALDELGLAPDLIVGASVGAVVGSLRAAGRSAREIEGTPGHGWHRTAEWQRGCRDGS
jgi:hypothetical protein